MRLVDLYSFDIYCVILALKDKTGLVLSHEPHPTGNSKLIILAAIAKMPPIHKNTFDAIPQLINPSPHPIKGSVHSPDLLSQQRTNMISDPAS